MSEAKLPIMAETISDAYIRPYEGRFGINRIDIDGAIWEVWRDSTGHDDERLVKVFELQKEEAKRFEEWCNTYLEQPWVLYPAINESMTFILDTQNSENLAMLMIGGPDRRIR